MNRFPTRRENLEFEAVVQAGADAVIRFEQMLLAGESVSMAATLATRTPPRTGIDDRTLMANAPKVSEMFKNEPWMLERYRQGYKQATGETLPDDAVVYRSLVDYPGDPAGIVTHKHGLQAVKKAMKERNVRVEGDWENHPVSAPPKPQVERMNKQVLERYKAEYKMENEEYSKIDERDLEAEIIHNHTKVVTPDDVMNAATSVDEAYDRTFAGTPWASKD